MKTKKKYWQIFTQLSECQKLNCLFIIWLIIIFGLSTFFTQDLLLPFAPSYAGSEILAANSPWKTLARLSGFDGIHYYHIIEQGYQNIAGVQAFFPLYPLLIKLLASIIPLSPIVIGVSISIICFYLFLRWSFNDLRQDYSAKIAWWWVWIWLSFPSSFFLFCFYTESLFLLLLWLAFRAYQRRHFGKLLLFGGLLSATRLVGAVAITAIALDFLYQSWQQKTYRQLVFWRQLLIIAVSNWGLVAYGLYLQITFGDPLLFVHVQSVHFSGRQTDKLITIPQVIYRYGKMFFANIPLSWKTYALTQEFIFSLLALALLIIIAIKAWREKKMPLPLVWWLFSVGAFVLPTLTGSFASMPRYLLACICLPAFLAIIFAQKKIWGQIFLLCCWCLLSINLLLFIAGLWVA